MGEKLMPSACEVDVMGAISMYALALAAGTPSAILDWNNNYGLEPDKCVCTHCGNFPKSFIGETPEIGELDVLGAVIGSEKCFGAVKGKVQPGPMTFFRASTDDRLGTIKAYVGEGDFTADPFPMDGGIAVTQVDAAAPVARLHRPQRLRASCRHGARPLRRGRQRGDHPLSRLADPSPRREAAAGRLRLPVTLMTAETRDAPQDLTDRIRAKRARDPPGRLTMVHDARQGHPGGDMSVIDILATLYFGVMRYDPQAPRAPIAID